MRAAAARASSRMEMAEFLMELKSDTAPVGDGGIGLPKSSYARLWFGRVPRVAGPLTPDLASPFSGDFLSLLGEHARRSSGDPGTGQR